VIGLLMTCRADGAPAAAGIARDLHDVVAHTLMTINVQVATAAQLLERNPGHAQAALQTIEDASRVVIGE
jgi:signal transduction histidine kinase